jgi:hypothetical protein
MLSRFIVSSKRKTAPSSLWICALMVICLAKFYKSDVILDGMTSSNTFFSSSSKR